MSPLRRIITGAVIAALGGLGVAALRMAEPPAMVRDETAPVDQARPHEPASRRAARGFVGVIIAGEVVDVAARTGGLIHEVKVRLGDRVTRDSAIATIDDGPLRDELAVARAALSAALADQERAGLELEEARQRAQRWRDLAGSDGGVPVVSEEKLTSLRYEEKYAAQSFKAAKARVAEARAQVHSLERRVADTVVRAPFDGVVARRFVDSGATVSTGDPVVRLVREGELWVRFAVPEARASALERGRGIEVRVDASEPEPGPVLGGTIEKIAPEVDAASQMIFVEGRLTVPPALDDTPLAGRVARVHVSPPGTDRPPVP